MWHQKYKSIKQKLCETKVAHQREVFYAQQGKKVSKKNLPAARKFLLPWPCRWNCKGLGQDSTGANLRKKHQKKKKNEKKRKLWWTRLFCRVHLAETKSLYLLLSYRKKISKKASENEKKTKIWWTRSFCGVYIAYLIRDRQKFDSLKAVGWSYKNRRIKYQLVGTSTHSILIKYLIYK